MDEQENNAERKNETREEIEHSGGSGMTFDEMLDSNPAWRSEFDRRNTKAVQTARAKWQQEQVDSLDEAKRLSRMTEAQRERYQLDKDRAAFARQQAEFAAQQMEVSVGAELQKRGLSAEFAPYLAGKDAEESAQRIDTFERLWNQAHAERIKEQMRGDKPPREPASQNLSREQIKNLSTGEINARWEEIQEILKEG